MTPTMHLRFIERQPVIAQNADPKQVQAIKVLQQFWETPTGKDVMSDAFIQIHGVWKDVPFVKD